LPASSTKKYEQKIFLLYKKNMSVWNFQCVHKTRFFSVFADGRIKPWFGEEMYLSICSGHHRLGDCLILTVWLLYNASICVGTLHAVGTPITTATPHDMTINY
jgi:hypothetical protein